MTTEDVKSWLSDIGAEWPDAHPENGEPLTSGSVMQEADHRRVRMIPPGPRPEPIEDVYDDVDGFYIGTRTLAAPEYAERIDAWEKYCADWKRMCGQMMQRGEVTISGEFKTDRGSTASGIWAGEWHWQEWSCSG